MLQNPKYFFWAYLACFCFSYFFFCCFLSKQRTILRNKHALMLKVHFTTLQSWITKKSTRELFQFSKEQMKIKPLFPTHQTRFLGVYWSLSSQNKNLNHNLRGQLIFIHFFFGLTYDCVSCLCDQLCTDFPLGPHTAASCLSSPGDTDSVCIYSNLPPSLFSRGVSARRQALSVARTETSHVWPVSVAASVSIWSCWFLWQRWRGCWS